MDKVESQPTPVVPNSRGPELSIVIPTYCEHGNVKELVARVDRCLVGVRWELVFVDDNSSDGTADLARAISQEDVRVRCLQRIGRRVLSSAVIEGALATSAPFIAVMDADLQHDERLLPEMLEILRRGEQDVVVGSRYVTGGGIGNWDESRVGLGRLATRLRRAVLKADLRDPMSGFFAIRRDAFMGSVGRLSAIGFKILLDIFASSPKPLRFVELPCTFRTRQVEESKFDSQTVWNF